MAQPKKSDNAFAGIILWMLLGIFTAIGIGSAIAFAVKDRLLQPPVKCEATK